jgi:hypothetical protein
LGAIPKATYTLEKKDAMVSHMRKTSEGRTKELDRVKWLFNSPATRGIERLGLLLVALLL